MTYSILVNTLSFYGIRRLVEQTQDFKNFLRKYFFVYVEYLCTCSPTWEQKFQKLYYNFNYCNRPELAEYSLYTKNKACVARLFNELKKSVHNNEYEVEFVSLKEIGQEE